MSREILRQQASESFPNAQAAQGLHWKRDISNGFSVITSVGGNLEAKSFDRG